MYRVIIAPTEESDFENSAIDAAVKLAQRFDAVLHLVQVLAPSLVADTLPRVPALESTEQALGDERLLRLQKLEALGSKLRAGSRIRVITALKEGNVTQTLRDYVAELEADLIVMSSHFRGGLKRLNLGSVTDFLVRNTNIPVLIVKPDVSLFEEAPEATALLIVVPLDGSAMAEQILPEVVAFASALNATVSLLRVLTPQNYAQKQIIQPGFPWWDADIAAADAYLSGHVDELIGRGIVATKDVTLNDDVPTAILDHAIRARANLIAIATNGIGGIRQFVFGTVADEVSRRSQISLLVFRPDVEAVTANRDPASAAGAATRT